MTRGADTLPIAAVPNLQPGDKLWIHPNLPPTQSVRYLLICAFLRGTTNPPPDEWFTRVPTWDKHVREEGIFLTVPAEAQQAVLFLAPETGGDFGTLKSAVKGRPGTFVRASQDLAEAGFEQARIEKYLASIRQVPPADSADLQKHSDLLARTLALKPNEACFKQPVDMQFTCLTQVGSQQVLDDGHGQTLVTALSNGANSDFINAASYTKLGGAGEYSAYVGAIVDLFRVMGNLHTAQYQYIPAIAFPQGDALNLRLNTPPSFHNPKSVLVIGLPAVQKATPPPLRPADASHVACLLKPRVVLPIEGAPLVFSTSFAHDMVLQLNTPEGAMPEPDIPLSADAYQGGLVLQTTSAHHVELHDTPPPPKLLTPVDSKAFARPDGAAKNPAPRQVADAASRPVLLTGTIRGRWGFDPFVGPDVKLQQLPGTGWHIVRTVDPTHPSRELIAGRAAQILIAATGTACVHTITTQPPEATTALPVLFKPETAASDPADLSLSLPLEHAVKPGDLHLQIQQYGQPQPDELAARTFIEPAHVSSIEIHAGDRSLRLLGTDLTQVQSVRLGDLVFRPATAEVVATATLAPSGGSVLQLSLPGEGPAPPTKADQRLSAVIALADGRTFTEPVRVEPPRPAVSLLRKSSSPETGISAATLILGSPDDIPLSQRLTFTLKSAGNFPRNGQVEVATLDGTLRAVLTLAPSGGLILQDPHTVVATLDPLRSFGPSAFGPLHLRVVFPEVVSKPRNEAASTSLGTAETASKQPFASDTEASPSTSDWLTLGTLVRLPTLTQLACPADPAQLCTLTGENLYLLQSIATDAQFTNPTAVPDGFTGTTLQVPHTNTDTLYLKLRDDPGPVGAANVTVPPVAATSSASTAGFHKAKHP